MYDENKSDQWTDVPAEEFPVFNIDNWKIEKIFHELNAEDDKKEPADSIQIGGDHYKKLVIQPWSAMESWMTKEQFIGFLRGNSIKYLARFEFKGGTEDLKKARHYLDKLIEVSEK